MYEFISGAMAAASLTVGFFFAQFYKKLGDRFFLLFAIAFNILAFERIILLFFQVRNESQPGIYLIRLAAFLIILSAIVDKNRKTT